MNIDIDKEKRLSIGHFLFANTIYLVLWLGILTGIAVIFDERRVYFLLIFATLPLILSLRILLIWKKSKKRDFVFLGIITTFIFTATSYVLYDWTSSDIYKFHQFSKIVRNNTRFGNVELHPKPEVGKGINNITGTIDTVEDFIQLKSLTEKYEISGIGKIRITENDDEEIESSL